MVEIVRPGSPTAVCQRRAEEFFQSHFRNPSAPQADEVQRLVSDLASRDSDLETQNQELRKTQRQLEACQSRYVDLYDFAPLGYVTLDEGGYVQEINLSGAALLNLDRDGIIGYPFSAYVAKKDEQAFQEHVRTCVCEHREATSEMSLVANGGRLIDVQLHSIPVDDAEPGVVFCKTAITDLTEHRKLEEAVRQSRAFLQTVIDAMPDMMVVIDLDYHVVQANRATREVVAGRNPSAECLMCYKVLHGRESPCEGPGVSCPLKEVIVTHTPVATTHVHLDAQGREVFLDVRASPVYDDAGRVTHVIELCRDVTEQKQAERKLRLTQFAVDRAGDGIFWVEKDARIVYANAQACRVLGYGLEEILRLRVHDIDPDFPAERWPEHWEELKQRGAFTFESRQRTKDGRLFPVEVTVNYLEAEGRECNCAIVRDITERKRIEESLREANRRSISILESISEGFVSFDRQWRYTYVNEAAARMLRKTPDELLGSVIWDAFPEAVKLRFYTEFQRAMAEATPLHFEEFFPPLDAWYECHCFPHPEGLSVYFQDVIERKRAEAERKANEESLRESEQRFRTVVVSSQDAIVAISADGLVTIFNPAAEKMFGYEESELVGQAVDCLMPEEYRERHRRGREGYFATGEPRTFMGRTVELPGLRRNGEVFPVELSLSEGWLGGKRFVLAIIRDISERKRAEEGLRQMQERVLQLQRQEKAIVEAELNKARETLIRQTKLAAVGQLSGTIAHELRNPLAGIGFGVDLLRKYVPEDSEGRQYLGMIEGEVRTADEIITDCMAMSRGRPPSKEKISLSKVLAHARAQVNAPEHIEWRYELELEPFMFHADAAQLEQVFRNLFSNAIQALGESGSITVEARHSGEYDEIRVCDNGPGIPQEVRDRVFEPLVTTKTRGTGLGLAICRQIIEQHGGTIEVLARDLPGATFQIRLPATGA